MFFNYAEWESEEHFRQAYAAKEVEEMHQGLKVLSEHEDHGSPAL